MGVEPATPDGWTGSQQAAPAELDLAASTPRRPMLDSAPFTPTDGVPIRVSCVMEPLYELQRFNLIGFRIARRVVRVHSGEQLRHDHIANLSRADILRIDLATIARGLDRLKAEDGARHPSVIIPVSYTSLSSQRGRDEIIAALAQVRDRVDKGVICEICDIDGVPQVGLLAAVSMIRPFVLLVVGRLNTASPTAIAALRGSGLQAIAFECPADQPDAAVAEWAKLAIGAARRVVRSVLIYRANSAASAALARQLGASHATIQMI